MGIGQYRPSRKLGGKLSRATPKDTVDVYARTLQSRPAKPRAKSVSFASPPSEKVTHPRAPVKTFAEAPVSPYKPKPKVMDSKPVGLGIRPSRVSFAEPPRSAPIQYAPKSKVDEIVHKFQRGDF